jgi:Helix-turn-helix domain
VTDEQPHGGPTVRRMLLGAQLRRLRTEAGVSRQDAGEAIRRSEWKILRLETGQVSFKERDIADLLTRYGVTDPLEIATLITMAREANLPGWWNAYSDLLPRGSGRMWTWKRPRSRSAPIMTSWFQGCCRPRSTCVR